MVTGANIFVFLVIAAAVTIGVTVWAFVVFNRFLGKEKERGERFREIHLKPPDER